MEPSTARNRTIAALGGLLVLGGLWRACSSEDDGPVPTEAVAERANLDPPLPNLSAFQDPQTAQARPVERLLITREPVTSEKLTETELAASPLIAVPDFQQFVDMLAQGDSSLANQLLRLDWSRPEHRAQYASWRKSFEHLPDLAPFGEFTESARTLTGAVFLASCTEKNAEDALQWQSPQMIAGLGIAALERRGAIHHANMLPVPERNPDLPRPNLDLPSFNDSVLAESRDVVIGEELLLVAGFLQHNGYFVTHCISKLREAVENFEKLQDTEQRHEAIDSVMWHALPLVVLARQSVSPASLAMFEAHRVRREATFAQSRSLVLPELHELGLRFPDLIGGYNSTTGHYVLPATPAERFFTALHQSVFGGIAVDVLIDPRHPDNKPQVKGLDPIRASNLITQWQQGVFSLQQAAFAAELMRFELLLHPQGIALDRLWPAWANTDPNLITVASRRARWLSGSGAAEALGGYVFPTTDAPAPSDLAANAELLRTFLLRGADGPATRLANELVTNPSTFRDQTKQGIGAVAAVTLDVARRSSNAAYLRSMLECIAAQDGYFFEAERVEGTMEFVFNFVSQNGADLEAAFGSLATAPNARHALVLAIALEGYMEGDASRDVTFERSRRRILAQVAGSDSEQSVSSLAVLGLLLGGSADEKFAGLSQALRNAEANSAESIRLEALTGVQQLIAPHCTDIHPSAKEPEPPVAEVAEKVDRIFSVPQGSLPRSLEEFADVVGVWFAESEDQSQVLHGSPGKVPSRYVEQLLRRAGNELQEL